MTDAANTESPDSMEVAVTVHGIREAHEQLLALLTTSEQRKAAEALWDEIVESYGERSREAPVGWREENLRKLFESAAKHRAELAAAGVR